MVTVHLRVAHGARLVANVSDKVGNTVLDQATTVDKLLVLPMPSEKVCVVVVAYKGERSRPYVDVIKNKREPSLEVKRHVSPPLRREVS